MTRSASRLSVSVVTIVSLFAIVFVATIAHAKSDKTHESIPDPSAKDEWCDDNHTYSDGRKVGYCEVREVTMAASRKLSADSGMNGGIAVKGSSRKDILVLAKVQAWAETEEEARELAGNVRIVASGGTIEPKGPEIQGDDSWWGVSFRIYTPKATDLDLEAFNGGISIEGVQGEIDFKTMNGGVSLRRVAGDVEGRTTNGALNVDLDGSRWAGEGLDLETVNGAVHVMFPANYNASFETGTTNGSVNIGFPIKYSGRNHGVLRTQVGKGGPPIRAVTTNGAVSVSVDHGD